MGARLPAMRMANEIMKIDDATSTPRPYRRR